MNLFIVRRTATTQGTTFVILLVDCIDHEIYHPENFLWSLWMLISMSITLETWKYVKFVRIFFFWGKRWFCRFLLSFAAIKEHTLKKCVVIELMDDKLYVKVFLFVKYHTKKPLTFGRWSHRKFLGGLFECLIFLFFFFFFVQLLQLFWFLWPYATCNFGV